MQRVQLGNSLRRIEIVAERRQHRRRKRFIMAARKLREVCQRHKRIEALLEPPHGPVNRLPIVRAQHVEAQHLPGPIRQQLPNGEEVAKALAHLLPLHLQEAVVHPIVRHHRRMERAARLRDLVLVMGKDKVDTAAMDVEGLAQMLPRHRRALDVPARAPGRRDP